MKKGCLFGTLGIIILLSLFLGYYFYTGINQTEKPMEWTNPFISDIYKKTVATGSIKPRKEVHIKPQVSGIVEKIYTEAGQIVKKGQKIAKIKLIPSPVNINNAESSVELARIRSKEAQRELSRQKSLNTQNLDIQQTKVSYDQAKLEEERQKNMLEEGLISQQAYQLAVVDLEVKKAAFENAQISSTASLKQFEAEVDIRAQELEAAINNLQLLREGASKNSKQVSNVVTSTVEGMILDMPIEEGMSVIERNNFNEGTSIALIADMNSLIFEGKVDESDVGKLKEGMQLKLKVGAIEDEEFDASLEHISPKGVLEEGTVKFEIRAAIQPKSSTFLRAGYSASGDIILAEKKQVVSIKERDIIFQNDSTLVAIKKGENEVEKKLVKTGLSDGINIEILQGLDTTSTIQVLN